MSTQRNNNDLILGNLVRQSSDDPKAFIAHVAAYLVRNHSQTFPNLNSVADFLKSKADADLRAQTSAATSVPAKVPAHMISSVFATQQEDHVPNTKFSRRSAYQDSLGQIMSWDDNASVCSASSEQPHVHAPSQMSQIISHGFASEAAAVSSSRPLRPGHSSQIADIYHHAYIQSNTDATPVRNLRSGPPSSPMVTARPSTSSNLGFTARNSADAEVQVYKGRAVGSAKRRDSIEIGGMYPGQEQADARPLCIRRSNPNESSSIRELLRREA